jgi:hypothetical protein
MKPTTLHCRADGQDKLSTVAVRDISLESRAGRFHAGNRKKDGRARLLEYNADVVCDENFCLDNFWSFFVTL